MGQHIENRQLLRVLSCLILLPNSCSDAVSYDSWHCIGEDTMQLFRSHEWLYIAPSDRPLLFHVSLGFFQHPVSTRGGGRRRPLNADPVPPPPMRTPSGKVCRSAPGTNVTPGCLRRRADDGRAAAVIALGSPRAPAFCAAFLRRAGSQTDVRSAEAAAAARLAPWDALAAAAAARRHRPGCRRQLPGNLSAEAATTAVITGRHWRIAAQGRLNWRSWRPLVKHCPGWPGALSGG